MMADFNIGMVEEEEPGHIQENVGMVEEEEEEPGHSQENRPLARFQLGARGKPNLVDPANFR